MTPGIGKRYQFQPPYPFSPGGELSGTITQAHPSVKHLKVGDRVLGLSGWGALAEYVQLPAEKLVKIPDSMDLLVASGFLMTYGTGIHALRDRGALKAGETVLILGAAGGVGVAAIELSKAMGARVIACASTAEKLATCKKFGADEVINYTTENLKSRIAELTGGDGPNVIYDAVGGDLAEVALRCIAWRGRYLVIGFAAGTIPKIPLNLTLLKGCSIVGVFWGSFTGREPEEFEKDVRLLFEWYSKGLLKPAANEVYALTQAVTAIQRLQERKVQGKAVVQVQGALTKL